jgi:site-specific DNA recombinase
MGMKARPSGKRVGLYARVSTQEQALEGLSIETQLAHLHAYATSQGWEVTGEDIDPGYSGSDDDRPGLKHLLGDARRHRFDIVAVAKLDRFFRNLRLLLNYLHEFDELGIKFVSTQEMLDTSTHYGKFAVQIMGVIAEFERNRISERIRENRQYRLTLGKWTSGRAPYGYRWLPKEQRWEIIEDEARIIRYIYQLYMKEKVGTMGIPARLNAEGYHTRDGGLWHFSSVLTILSNPAYKGRHEMGIAMPVIIDEATWEQARQQRLRARKVQGEVRDWLLQGICVCGLCGHMLRCQQKTGSKQRHYVCRGRYKTYHSDGSPTCTLPYEHAQQLEFLVWNKVRNAFNDPVTLKSYVEDALAELEEKKSKIGGDALDLDEQIETVKRKKERLGMAFADEAIPEKIYRTKLQQLHKQEMSLEERRYNLDPNEMMEVTDLSNRITTVREILQKGKIQLTDLGFFGTEGDKYIPLGFNPWPETDSKKSIGKPAEVATAVIDDETGLIGKTVLPPGFMDPGVTPSEKRKRIIRNMRSLLRFLNIKVIIYPDRKEIRGAIPPQVIEVSAKDGNSVGCRITSSAKGLRDGAVCKRQPFVFHRKDTFWIPASA